MLEDGEIDEEEVDVVESIEISKLEAELAEAQSSGNKRTTCVSAGMAIVRRASRSPGASRRLRPRAW